MQRCPETVVLKAARREVIEKRRSNMASLDMGIKEKRLLLEYFVQSEYAKRRRNYNYYNHEQAYASSQGRFPYNNNNDNNYNNNNTNNNNDVMMHGGDAESSYYAEYPPMFLPLNYPKYGVASVCGRRKDMEDAVAIEPSFTLNGRPSSFKMQFYAVYDGHGCGHVSLKCRERLHEIVKEEIETSTKWRQAMVKSFRRMDEEVASFNKSAAGELCRCDRSSIDDSAGSTAVVAIVTPEKIIVANVGDSRAVLCRNGQAIPLSSDHKPDRPDERERIEAAGGQILYWGGARVMGVLAMSRAIGDNYLKPFVSCEPEVTITNRTPEDDCLILGSDGLWDLVSNETACGVAKMCMQDFNNNNPQNPAALPSCKGKMATDKGCCDAATLLTKLALGRKSQDNVSVLVVDLKK